MNKITRVVLLFLLISTSCHKDGDNNKLTIATAANMQFVMKELARSFFETSGIECETIVASSGKLTAMIQEGAPFDVFVSADMKYPKQLHEGGLTTELPKIYAYGHLVLWSTKNATLPGVEELAGADIKHVALANPRTAPYGLAAVEVLQHFGLYEAIETKLVFGESISQTNQFILSGAAELGFTAKSVVLSPALKGKGVWIELEAQAYKPIAQGVVLLNNRDKYMTDAKRFHDFLFSRKARNILTQYGYSVDL